MMLDAAPQAPEQLAADTPEPHVDAGPNPPAAVDQIEPSIPTEQACRASVAATDRRASIGALVLVLLVRRRKRGAS